MKRKRGRGRVGRFLEVFSLRATEWAGTSIAFGVASAVILGWIATGPLFGFSDTWQLVINTGTTIVTFLMVFLIQRAQNKESRVVQLKLSEIVAALTGASNRLIDVESLSERELETLHRHYHALAKLAAKETDIHLSHSIDEAERRHEAKTREAKKVGGPTSD
ncbi:MAG TPA: low affinity iron permease family protein [Myxococcota bacterium]|nr:low affinity iron permease family protein [Myxococcota bacterium]